MPNPALRHFDPTSKQFSVVKPFVYNGRHYRSGDVFGVDYIGVTLRKVRLLWDNRNLGPLSEVVPAEPLPAKGSKEEEEKDTRILFNPDLHSVVNVRRRWVVVDQNETELYRVKAKVGRALDQVDVETEVSPDDIIAETE